METMKLFELRATGQKSYYGKANVIAAILKSSGYTETNS